MAATAEPVVFFLAGGRVGGAVCFFGQRHVQLSGLAVITGVDVQHLHFATVDEGHGLLIPFVVLVLFWWKRKDLLAKPPGLWWPAIGLIGFALLLHLVGLSRSNSVCRSSVFFWGCMV